MITITLDFLADPQTVETHFQNLPDKLSVNELAALVEVLTRVLRLADDYHEAAGPPKTSRRLQMDIEVSELLEVSENGK